MEATMYGLGLRASSMKNGKSDGNGANRDT